MNVMLIARREQHIEHLAGELKADHDVEVFCLARDLGNPETISDVKTALADKEVGVLVYNAAHIPLGSFIETDASDIDQAIAVNVRSPIALIRAIVPGMRSRRRGGIVLMSSLAGLQGAPGLVTYSSTKAFNIILGEGLWRNYERAGST